MVVLVLFLVLTEEIQLLAQLLLLVVVEADGVILVLMVLLAVLVAVQVVTQAWELEEREILPQFLHHKETMVEGLSVAQTVLVVVVAQVL
jgi:hypothetical protein